MIWDKWQETHIRNSGRVQNNQHSIIINVRLGSSDYVLGVILFSFQRLAKIYFDLTEKPGCLND